MNIRSLEEQIKELEGKGAVMEKKIRQVEEEINRKKKSGHEIT